MIAINHEEYAELYAEALRLDDDFEPVQIDIEQLPGESSYETIIRFMEESGMISFDGDDLVILDEEKIVDYNPNLMKVMDAILMSQMQATWDALEAEGLIYTTIDDVGNIIRVLTDAGQAALDDEDY